MGKHREQKTIQVIWGVRLSLKWSQMRSVWTFWLQRHGLSGVEGLFSVKHIVFCMFKAGLCLWVFLGWQIQKNPSFFCWLLEKGPLSHIPDLFHFYYFQWFRSVSSITLGVNHSNDNILSTIAHSFFILKVLSTCTLFQEIFGRERLDGGLSSYLCPFTSGSMMATITVITRVFMG